MNNAPNIPAERFTAMTRLDHNRAIAQLAVKAGAPVTDVTKMTIWGNHSATQYPDIFHAGSGRTASASVDDQAWLENDFIPTVQQRGAAIIEARGARRRPRAANAAIDHVHDWVLGTAAGDWVSMAIRPTAPTACPRGSSPRSRARRPTATTRSSRASSSTTLAGRIDASVAELAEERERSPSSA